jgi:hypothetical protein
MAQRLLSARYLTYRLVPLAFHPKNLLFTRVSGIRDYASLGPRLTILLPLSTALPIVY